MLGVFLVNLHDYSHGQAEQQNVPVPAKIAQETLAGDQDASSLCNVLSVGE